MVVVVVATVVETMAAKVAATAVVTMAAAIKTITLETLAILHAITAKRDVEDSTLTKQTQATTPTMSMAKVICLALIQALAMDVQPVMHPEAQTHALTAKRDAVDST